MLALTAKLLFGLIALEILVASAVTSQGYGKVIQQDYLAAQSLRDGLGPYISISDLTAHYMPGVTYGSTVPPPHPLVLLALFLPFTYLPYVPLTWLWLWLGIALWLWIGRRLGLTWPASFAGLILRPVLFAVDLDQWEIPILALLALAWQMGERGRDLRAGLLLGLAVALKIYPALFLLPFLLERRWRVPLGSAAAFLAARLLGIILVGPLGFLRYWTEVLPAVTRRWVMDTINLAPYPTALRLGLGTPAALGLSTLLALLALLGLYLAHRRGLGHPASGAAMTFLWPSLLELLPGVRRATRVLSLAEDAEAQGARRPLNPTGLQLGLRRTSRPPWLRRAPVAGLPAPSRDSRLRARLRR